MAHQTWYFLARLDGDHPGWEEERERLETRLRQAVDATAEEYASVVFAAWTTLADGTCSFYYETRSPAVRDYFQALSALPSACIQTWDECQMPSPPRPDFLWRRQQGDGHPKPHPPFNSFS